MLALSFQNPHPGGAEKAECNRVAMAGGRPRFRNACGRDRELMDLELLLVNREATRCAR